MAEVETKLGRSVKSMMEEWRRDDPELQAEYERLAPRYAAIDALIAARLQAGLTQRALAAKMGIQPSVLARIESGSDAVKLDTLARAAAALGHHLVVQFVPADSAIEPVQENATLRPRSAATRKAR